MLRATRFSNLYSTALTLGLLLAHVLELPGKQSLSGPEWLAVQHNLYGGFALVGGLSELLALVSVAALLPLLRGRRAAFAWTLLGAACLVALPFIFYFGNNPINGRIASWTPATLPPDWAQQRDRWEGFHAASAALAAAAFAALLVAALRDTASPGAPDRAPRTGGAETDRSVAAGVSRGPQGPREAAGRASGSGGRGTADA
jgi:hypothetical protein